MKNNGSLNANSISNRNGWTKQNYVFRVIESINVTVYKSLLNYHDKASNEDKLFALSLTKCLSRNFRQRNMSTGF